MTEYRINIEARKGFGSFIFREGIAILRDRTKSPLLLSNIKKIVLNNPFDPPWPLEYTPEEFKGLGVLYHIIYDFTNPKNKTKFIQRIV